jgi:hypothetical protein
LTTNFYEVFIFSHPDDEDIRENLSTASLDTIVERAKSAEPATQLAAVQVKLDQRIKT